jgi:4-aminobutyrate aminotransferase-like enzyme
MPSIDVRALLDARAGEELALNDRHLNPQLGRILRTLGFDRSWRGAEGSHLIDASGDRYLDMLAGYGVFSVGRNNPRVRAQLEAALEADTANLPQLGVTLLAGVLAEQLLARAPQNLGHAVLTSTGTETVEAAIKLARGATGRARILYCEHAFHGLTNGSLALNGSEEFRAGFGPLAPSTRPTTEGRWPTAPFRAYADTRSDHRPGHRQRDCGSPASWLAPSGCSLELGRRLPEYRWADTAF